MGRKKVPRKKRTRRQVKCLSCGKGLEDLRRRYCSGKCRQELERKLDLSIGLLKTLCARYATFSFTESTVCLHVLPSNSKEVLSYICERNVGAKPAQDLWQLVDGLGRAWHTKKKATGKRYLATRHLQEQARRDQTLPGSMKPVDEKKPALRRRSLQCFNLAASDLLLPHARDTLKAAYRREAKIHHPDHGGDADSFRKIHEAHQELIAWMKDPRFSARRGVRGKWSYDSLRSKKWLPPAVQGKTRG